jgi:hypothetical protein
MRTPEIHLCEQPRCGRLAVERFGRKWLCDSHLNPDIPEPTVEDAVLVRSSWAPCDELEPFRAGNSVRKIPAPPKPRTRRRPRLRRRS